MSSFLCWPSLAEEPRQGVLAVTHRITDCDREPLVCSDWCRSTVISQMLPCAPASTAHRDMQSTA